MFYMWTYVVEHLFICLFAIFISSLVRCLLKSLAYFFNQIVFGWCFVRLFLGLGFGVVFFFFFWWTAFGILVP